jgi:F0F1-type ATP synthase membrane subunit c/vacuolar-type H+-ATPase subunit K
MPQRTADLGPGLRVLLAIIGTAALGSGIIIAATELRLAYRGSPVVPALFASLVAGLAALGGGLLIRGAVRGRIAVRDPRDRG